MRYPEKLKKGHKIGIIAPSLGVTGPLSEMLDEGIRNLISFTYRDALCTCKGVY